MADQEWRDLIRSLADTMYEAVERQQRWHAFNVVVTAQAVNHVNSSSAESLPRAVAEAIGMVLDLDVKRES